MPLRSMKMKRFIFGFQRRAWWPKCTPDSSNCFIVTTAMRVSPLFLRLPHHRGGPASVRSTELVLDLHQLYVCCVRPRVLSGPRGRALAAPSPPLRRSLRSLRLVGPRGHPRLVHNPLAPATRSPGARVGSCRWHSLFLISFSLRHGLCGVIRAHGEIRRSESSKRHFSKVGSPHV